MNAAQFKKVLKGYSVTVEKIRVFTYISDMPGQGETRNWKATILHFNHKAQLGQMVPYTSEPPSLEDMYGYAKEGIISYLMQLPKKYLKP